MGQRSGRKKIVTCQSLRDNRECPFWAALGHGNQPLTSRCYSDFSESALSGAFCFFFLSVLVESKKSRPISRVLSRATIPLGCTSPCTSSGLPGNTRGPRAAACAACFPIWPCSWRGFPCRRRYRRRGALLPHHFTLAVVLAHAWAVSFLLHFPWAHAPQALPGAVPCGARTFLRFREKTAIAWPTSAANIVGPGPALKWICQRCPWRARAPAHRRHCGARRSVPPPRRRPRTPADSATAR